MTTDQTVSEYLTKWNAEDLSVFSQAIQQIEKSIPQAEGKVWHGHPVWFIAGNPIVGLTLKKAGIEVLFWSGQSFPTPGLKATGKYKAAGHILVSLDISELERLKTWLIDSIAIQWDYQNLTRKRVLEQLTEF